VKFDSAGNEIGIYKDTPSFVSVVPRPYLDFTNLQDGGRFAITYDDVTSVDASGNETSHLVTDIVDFRGTGALAPQDDSGLHDGLNQYVAGSQYNDTFIGENNVQNFYYFHGDSNTTPTDSFTGGTGIGAWNTAIFADPVADFTFQTSGTGPRSPASTACTAAR
jgi:hypothetical protein